MIGYVGIESGNKGEEIARKVKEDNHDKKEEIELNTTNDIRKITSAGSTQLNKVSVLMTIVTIFVMACSALYFVINV